MVECPSEQGRFGSNPTEAPNWFSSAFWSSVRTVECLVRKTIILRRRFESVSGVGSQGIIRGSTPRYRNAVEN